MFKHTERSSEGDIEDFGQNPVLMGHYSFVDPQSQETAKSIMAEVTRYRRVFGRVTSSIATSCDLCAAPHLAKVIAAVAENMPVTFVLPAFPGKSPNPAKVLGPLPDMAERLALEFLQGLCDRVKAVYSPGAQVILCADGRVFSDVVGMRDEDVTAYQLELSNMIEEMGLASISTFNLDEFYSGLSFDLMRAKLMERFGDDLSDIRRAVSIGGKDQDSSVDDKETHRLYCGITRFLLEDAMFPGQSKTRSALQKDCRSRAYEVIQRSKAWGELVEARFPDAVRLSIHPQACGSKKLGIRLIEPDNWMTPWHGVAVDMGGRFMLLKRAQAEELGAELIHHAGRPSHYVLRTET